MPCSFFFLFTSPNSFCALLKVILVCLWDSLSRSLPFSSLPSTPKSKHNPTIGGVLDSSHRATWRSQKAPIERLEQEEGTFFFCFSGVIIDQDFDDGSTTRRRTKRTTVNKVRSKNGHSQGASGWFSPPSEGRLYKELERMWGRMRQ